MVWTWIWRKFSFQDKLFRRNLETVHFCLSSNRLEMSMGLYQINLFQSSNLNWIPTNLKKKTFSCFIMGHCLFLKSIHCISHFRNRRSMMQMPGCRNFCSSRLLSLEVHFISQIQSLRRVVRWYSPQPKRNTNLRFFGVLWKGPGIPLGRSFDGKIQGEVPTKWNFCPKRNASKTHLSFAVDCYLQPPTSFNYFLVTYGMSGAPINGWK